MARKRQVLAIAKFGGYNDEFELSRKVNHDMPHKEIAIFMSEEGMCPLDTLESLLLVDKKLGTTSIDVGHLI